MVGFGFENTSPPQGRFLGAVPAAERVFLKSIRRLTGIDPFSYLLKQPLTADHRPLVKLDVVDVCAKLNLGRQVSAIVGVSEITFPALFWASEVAKSVEKLIYYDESSVRIC